MSEENTPTPSPDTQPEKSQEVQARPKKERASTKTATHTHPIPVGSPPIYALTRCFILAHFRLGGGKVFGQENIPLKGRFILAANHVSHLDPPVISSFSPRRPHVIAKKELFSHPLVASYFRGLGAFPVDRGKADRKAIRRAIEVLESDAPLLIFPEGTRSTDGELHDAEIGLGMIAHATHAPLIPVYLKGSNAALSPMNPKFGIVKMELHYGKPLDLEAEYSRRGDRATIDAIGKKTMEAIAALRDAANGAAKK